MPTTTNYGWTTPADTDLVKDGAAAIRTLGSSVDTTVKNLNPETTLGDISYRSSTANTNTRLALGTAGQVLTVNSGATAPEWKTPSSGGMTLISTTTLSGAATNITSIPGTYVNLALIIVNYLPATDGARILWRFNNDSNARYSITNGGAFSATSIDFSETQDNAVSESLYYLDVPYYSNTTTWKMLYQKFGLNNNPSPSTSVNIATYHFGAYNQTAAITEINLISSSGNFTSGTAYLYGVK